MTDSGNNPFGEPDFSVLSPSGDDDTDDEFTDEDDGLEEEDDEIEEEAEAEDVANDADEDEEGDESSEAVGADEAVVVAEAGNRVEGGTARSVLEHVARSIVDDPAGVTVEVAEGRGGIRLSLHVAQGDMGRIIGRRGRTAQALRTLVRAAAARDGQEASVDIVD
jgi:uncharacterized protein